MITVNSRTEMVDWRVLGESRIAQNVCNLLRLWTGEVPFLRAMGMDTTLIHRPAPEAIIDMQAHIARMLADYEPDAEILDIRIWLDDRIGYTIEVDLEAEDV